MCLVSQLTYSQVIPLSDSSNLSWRYIGNPDFSGDTVAFPSLAITTGDIPYISFQNYANNRGLSIMKYNGSSWEYAGEPNLAQGRVYSASLAIGPSNQPYVAYEDDGSMMKSIVKKFNGTNWETVGQVGFSPNFVQPTNLAFSNTQEPYVSFVDGIALKANVMKFNGNSWVLVGPANFTPMTFCANLAFGPAGEIYLAYQDNTNAFKITILKFDGANWVAFGPAGPRVTDYLHVIKISIGPDGFPYICFPDTDHNRKATVMKCNGSSWTTIGNAGFSAGYAYTTEIKFDSNGNLYVAEDGNGSVTVWTYTNSAWIPVGLPDFAGAQILSLNFAINSSGNPNVAFISSSTSKLSMMEYGYPTGIKENLKNALHVYPNPATITVSIELPGSHPEPKTIVVTNISGKKLLEMKTNKILITIPVEDYPAGMYFVSVISSNSVWTGKFCKI